MGNEMPPRIKIGIALFFVGLLVAASVAVYTASENWKPDNKDLGEMMINWYFAELDEKVATSDLIVIATVSNKTGVWDTANGEKPSVISIYDTRISTEYTFRPDDVLKGNTSIFKGRVAGGTVDGYTLKATKTPSFEEGDKVLLFLKTNIDEEGNDKIWYHIGLPDAFYETDDGVFTNEYYGDVLVEELKNDLNKEQIKDSYA